ncbi:MAG: IS630 transposase-related protein [Pirellulales bacterium]
MRAYSLDLRERVMMDVDAGELKIREIADKYRVTTKWIGDLRRLRAETGTLEPRRGKPGPQPKLAAHAERLAQLVHERPDASLEELREALPVSVGATTVWRTLRELEFTFKKSDACR